MALSGPVRTVDGLLGLSVPELPVQAFFGPRRPPAGGCWRPPCNDPLTRADNLDTRPADGWPGTKEVSMPDIEMELVEVGGETFEWRLWAQFAATLLNFGELLADGRLDRMAYKEAVEAAEEVMWQAIGVQQDTFYAILYALGRKRTVTEPNETAMWQGRWPTT